MGFEDIFRAKYKIALNAARAADRDATAAALQAIADTFREQYNLDNGDPIVIKAKLSSWQGIFQNFAAIVRTNGLQDERVQAFFGLRKDAVGPTMGDYMSGAALPPLPSAPYAGNAPQPGAPYGKYQPKQEPPKGEGPLPKMEPPKPKQEPPRPKTEPPKPKAPQYPAQGADNGGGEDAPVYSPETLAGFIGQQHIVKPLLKEIAIAKNQGIHHLDNILLLGNPGLGKTTLMKLIAKELGAEYEWLDCSQFHNSKKAGEALQNFLLRVARENVPVVIAFDEIHMLPKDLQSALLTLLNSRVYVSPPDIRGKITRIAIDEFTFIAATTNDEGVLDTIKDRCLRLTFQMVDYTPEELRRIYRNKVASKGLTIAEDAIETCLPRSRGSMRYVDSFVEGMDKALYNDAGVRMSTHIDLETALRYFAEKGIDEIGLTPKDQEILLALEEAGGVIGADALAARVGLDPKKYLSEYEPYLVKIGFVIVFARGRSLTENSMQYLKQHYPHGGDAPDEGQEGQQFAPQPPSAPDFGGMTPAQPGAWQYPPTQGAYPPPYEAAPPIQPAAGAYPPIQGATPPAPEAAPPMQPAVGAYPPIQGAIPPAPEAAPPMQPAVGAYPSIQDVIPPAQPDNAFYPTLDGIYPPADPDLDGKGENATEATDETKTGEEQTE